MQRTRGGEPIDERIDFFFTCPLVDRRAADRRAGQVCGAGVVPPRPRCPTRWCRTSSGRALRRVHAGRTASAPYIDLRLRPTPAQVESRSARATRRCVDDCATQPAQRRRSTGTASRQADAARTARDDEPPAGRAGTRPRAEGGAWASSSERTGPTGPRPARHRRRPRQPRSPTSTARTAERRAARAAPRSRRGEPRGRCEPKAGYPVQGPPQRLRSRHGRRCRRSPTVSATTPNHACAGPRAWSRSAQRLSSAPRPPGTAAAPSLVPSSKGRAAPSSEPTVRRTRLPPVRALVGRDSRRPARLRLRRPEDLGTRTRTLDRALSPASRTHGRRLRVDPQSRVRPVDAPKTAALEIGCATYRARRRGHWRPSRDPPGRASRPPQTVISSPASP